MVKIFSFFENSLQPKHVFSFFLASPSFSSDLFFFCSSLLFFALSLGVVFSFLLSSIFFLDFSSKFSFFNFKTSSPIFFKVNLLFGLYFKHFLIIFSKVFIPISSENFPVISKIMSLIFSS